MKEVIHVVPSLFVPLDGYSRPEGRQVLCSRPTVTFRIGVLWLWQLFEVERHRCIVLFICAVNGATPNSWSWRAFPCETKPVKTCQQVCGQGAKPATVA